MAGIRGREIGRRGEASKRKKKRAEKQFSNQIICFIRIRAKKALKFLFLRGQVRGSLKDIYKV